jgi:hypothetical protein
MFYIKLSTVLKQIKIEFSANISINSRRKRIPQLKPILSLAE